MKGLPHFLKIVLFALLLTILHLGLNRFLAAPFAIVIILANLIAWNARQPLPWLVSWAIIFELYSVLPPGIVVLVFLLGLAAVRLKGRIELDISLTFIAWLSAVVFIQLVVILISAIGLSYDSLREFGSLMVHILSLRSVIVWVAVTLLSGLLCLVWQSFQRPVDHVLTLVSRRLPNL